jgi:hypothetical protein
LDLRGNEVGCGKMGEEMQGIGCENWVLKLNVIERKLLFFRGNLGGFVRE